MTQSHFIHNFSYSYLKLWLKTQQPWIMILLLACEVAHIAGLSCGATLFIVLAFCNRCFNSDFHAPFGTPSLQLWVNSKRQTIIKSKILPWNLSKNLPLASYLHRVCHLTKTTSSTTWNRSLKQGTTRKLILSIWRASLANLWTTSFPWIPT